MKKVLKCFILLWVVLFLLPIHPLAANNVSEIAIDVTLREDGSAYIVQNWRGTFQEGTENYIPIRTEGIAITDFRVSDIDGQYELVPYWDVDADFSEKARKCGILETDEGVELCFGITQYGENRYTISYIVEDFVKSYRDYDGTIFMLVNPGMNTFPTDCRVNFRLQDGTPLSSENAAIWAFGYVGEIEFSSGAVNAYTTQALDGEDYVTVMLRLEKDILSPKAQVDIPFEDVKDTAFEGSDYDSEEPSFWELVGILLVVVFTVGLTLVAIIVTIIRKVEIKKFIKTADYYRQIPNGGNLAVSYFLSIRFGITPDKSQFIGAVLMDMVNHGEIRPMTEETVGAFGKVKDTVSLQLVNTPTDPVRAKLYAILENAVGPDQILQEKELENYTYRHYSQLENFLQSTEGLGDVPQHRSTSSRHISRIRHLSDSGTQALAQVVGFKKYLEDFSLIAEREIREIGVWKDFMVYAMLFGIADRLEKQLKKIYPNSIRELGEMNRNVIICRSYNHSMYRSYQRAVQARNNGAGGASSFRGGGGFSGGGHGGGSR